MTEKKKGPEVLREYPAIGQYRVRMVKGRHGKVLDVREYITVEKFEGFTRRGCRLDQNQVKQLRDTLNEVLNERW